jgi:metallo-beta-lactamase family protein
MIISFLGAVGTVTGSKYLIEAGGHRVLIDCGLFQGLKPLRLRNWSHLPVAPNSIDAVILTHAHLDHSGYLPLLVRDGFKGPVFCTSGTKDLCSLLLPDSGHLQERDAEYANRHGFSKHKPALPLYTQDDAVASLKQFVPKELERSFEIWPEFRVCFRPAGHILGAAFVELTIAGKTLVFSGDLGRSNSRTMVDPAPLRKVDYLVVESTYGDRTHDLSDPEDRLADIIVKTAQRGGVVLIPTFAVGRAQSLLYHLHRLKDSHRIPELPVFLDSPMAIDASDIFCAHLGEHRLNPDQCRAMCSTARYVNSAEESKALDRDGVPKVILAASGMATGGRVLHHLKTFAPDPKNTILFAGFQAAGTRGAAMVGGAGTIKIHGEQISVRAEVVNLSMLSAHADRKEILAWLGHIDVPPKLTFVTHGEPVAATALQQAIESQLGWKCRVPQDQERVDLAEK